MNKQELLEAIQTKFNAYYKNDKTIKRLEKDVAKGIASYENMHLYSQTVGEIFGKAWEETVTADVLQDGMFYEEVAKYVMNPTIYNNYKLVSEYYVASEKLLYKAQGLGLTPPYPLYDQDMTNGLVTYVSGMPYSDIQTVLLESFVTNSIKVLDNAIKDNMDFLNQVGKGRQVGRRLGPSERIAGKKGRYGSYNIPCALCREFHNEIYNYGEEPEYFWSRHRGCRCVIETYENGKLISTK